MNTIGLINNIILQHKQGIVIYGDRQTFLFSSVCLKIKKREIYFLRTHKNVVFVLIATQIYEFDIIKENEKRGRLCLR